MKIHGSMSAVLTYAWYLLNLRVYLANILPLLWGILSEEVAINSICWEVKVNGQKVEIHALTYINTASNLVKLIRINNKTAKHIHDKLRSAGFAAIPDQYIACMTRGEFASSSFQWLLELFSIKDVCLTSKNPQWNAICEPMHQTVGNVLKTMVCTNPWHNSTQQKT